ncbi:MAG: Fic family protein [Roseimicrobium sp.]
MILNNYRTMQKLAEWKNEPLTQDLVFAIHRLITEETMKDATAAGRFRREDERIYVEDDVGEILHVPPPAAELPARMQQMCDFANAPDGDLPFLHPVMRAIILHFWLAYDHPFKDGNGRTSRAVFYWLMLRRGFWLFEYVSISQMLVKAPAQYARAFLHTETDGNDLNYFILHQLRVIRRSVDALHNYIERKGEELKQVSAALRRFGELNHRQEAILNRAIRHPGTIFTVESHRASHDTAYDTARTDLLYLVEHGLLTKRKRGKGFVFEAAPNLHTKLSGAQRP